MLLAKAIEAKVVRTNKVRADTTVVPATVAHPTDSGLLATVRRIGTGVRRIHAAGCEVRTHVRDWSLSASATAHGIAGQVRSRAQLGRDAGADVQRITGKFADLAESAITDARILLVNARRAADRARSKAKALAQVLVRDAAASRHRGRLIGAVNDLNALVEATEQIIGQTRVRLAGRTPDGSTRVVSLHCTQARPIAKGRLGRLVEFALRGSGCRQSGRHRAGP